jgi:hypothetical protein
MNLEFDEKHTKLKKQKLEYYYRNKDRVLKKNKQTRSLKNMCIFDCPDCANQFIVKPEKNTIVSVGYKNKQTNRFVELPFTNPIDVKRQSNTIPTSIIQSVSESSIQGSTE